jgi:hypothetical protein
MHAKPSAALAHCEATCDLWVFQFFNDAQPKRIPLAGWESLKRLRNGMCNLRIGHGRDVGVWFCRIGAELHPQSSSRTFLDSAAPPPLSQQVASDPKQPRPCRLIASQPRGSPTGPRLRERLRQQVSRHIPAA